MGSSWERIIVLNRMLVQINEKVTFVASVERSWRIGLAVNISGLYSKKFICIALDIKKKVKRLCPYSFVYVCPVFGQLL